MSRRDQKLQRAVNKLARFYGLHDVRSLTNRTSLEGPEPRPGPSRAGETRETSGRATDSLSAIDGVGGTSRDIGISDSVISTVSQLFVDSSEGAYDITQLTTTLNQLLAGAEQGLQDRYKQVFNIVAQTDIAQQLPLPTNLQGVKINDLLQIGDSSFINRNPNSPGKETPTLSLIFSNSKRISLTNKNVNACTIFLNGVPNVEIAKAVPYLDVQFLFPRRPVSDTTKRLQTPSLMRFLLGAKQIRDITADGIINPELSMASGSTTTMEVSEGRSTSQETYSIAGMELFTSPQTLVNANETDNEMLRSTPVLDKFRPFLTLKEFEVQVQSSVGLHSFKTAKLNFLLHDRSRLAEVADFVRPDLYGRTEILVEYGWIHPDGEKDDSSGFENAYGDLINGMRVREKYGIRNSSFTFDDNGQVNINLDLYTRGGTDLSTELISSNAESFGNVIREIEELQQLIVDLRDRTFGLNSGGSAPTRSREIRGIQILDAASDALGHSILSSDLRNELRNFRATLRNSGDSPNVSRLREALDELFGAETRIRTGRGSRGGVAAGGALGRLRTTVIEAITQKVQRLTTNEADPFLIQDYPPRPARTTTSRILGTVRRRGQEERRAEREYFERFRTAVNGTTSFANLMLHFVGEPLANTKKFDDIQLVFYPFNSYAGYASNLNIGNFEVDLNFFATEFTRVRLNSIGRSANMNLREFMNFIGQAVVDDPAARSYGLWDQDGGLYREVFDSDGNSRNTEAVDEVPRLQQRMENILRGVTPDGSFKMPQIEFFLECTPGKLMSVDGNTSDVDDSKSVLKIHIYDRQASSYETLGSLLASARNAEIEAVGRIPAGNSGNTSVSANSAQDAAAMITMAETFGLIEEIQNSDPRTYQLVGGPRKLKEFLYRTTPYIIYGAGGTLVKQANLSSQQNPELSTVNMLRSFRRSELEPNGELPGGLPMRIIPTELALETFGCPLLTYTGQFFVDFQTGTSADNIYTIIGLSHKISEGEFNTTVRMAPLDAYGRYDSFMNRIFNARQILVDIENRTASAENQTVPPPDLRREDGNTSTSNGPATTP